MVTALKNNTDIITLNNGDKIPAVGLGTWQATEKNAAYNSVKAALQNGYRHIDTAAIYGNEEEVGKGIKDSGLPREEIYITTKIWNGDHKKAEEALNTSLKKLGLEYIDLYLIHWPVSSDPETKEAYNDWDYVDTYKELQKLKASGRVKAIGVSNFSVKNLEKLLADKDITIKPVVNQIEAHPLLTQPELTQYLKKNDIVIEAYSPLGSTNSPLFKNETVVNIAEKYQAEPAQVLVSWAIQRDTVVLPKSVTESRIIANLKTFKLSDEDFETLNKLSQKDGAVRTCNPPFNNFDD